MLQLSDEFILIKFCLMFAMTNAKKMLFYVAINKFLSTYMKQYTWDMDTVFHCGCF